MGVVQHFKLQELLEPSDVGVMLAHWTLLHYLVSPRR
jgi:hypothetical protein